MPTPLRARLGPARAIAAGVSLAGVGAVGVALAPSSAVAQSTTSTSFVSDHRAPSCAQSDAPGPIASAACIATPLVGGTGTATAVSNYQVRVASTTANLTQTGGSLDADADAQATLFSALAVTGTPQPGDQLVFHFLGVESLGGSGGDANASGFWRLVLSGATDFATADRTAFADGTQDPLHLVNARQTSGGFDLFVSFPSGSLFNYIFGVAAHAHVAEQPVRTAVGGGITMRLDGVDAETAQGGYISSAVFDPRTGLGSITVPVQSTVPEPNVVALLATGLAALFPLVRRRRMPLARGQFA